MWNNPNSEIERQLSSGEKLLWSGQPAQGIRFRPADIFVIPFSLLWCGFAIFWEGSVIHARAPFFFKLWGIPFVLVGLYFVVGRFIVDARARARTFYGVTSERIIIIGGAFSRETKSLQLRTLSDISLVERADGRGTITFGLQFAFASRLPAGWPDAGRYAPPVFEMIERANETYDLILQAQKSVAGAAS